MHHTAGCPRQPAVDAPKQPACRVKAGPAGPSRRDRSEAEGLDPDLRAGCYPPGRYGSRHEASGIHLAVAAGHIDAGRAGFCPGS